MKKIIKSFIFAFFAFLFINTVYADFECNLNVVETGINKAEFEVVMPICKTKSQPDGFMEIEGNRKGSYSEAWNLGLEVVDSYYDAETADGKDIYQVHAKVPICSNTNRRVVAYSTCTGIYKWKEEQTHYCASNYFNASDCSTNSSCSWDSKVNKCLGSWTTRYCPEGWSSINASECKRDSNYQYKEVVSGTAGIPSVKAACRNATGADECDSCSTVQYALECPAYSCEKENIKISACTPEFSLDGNALYCVNPGQHFNIGYKEDTDFNVRSCANSYITPDCGYANILIEGAFHKNTSDDAINLALRLWSYHTNQKGFEDTGKTGIANRKGESCDQSVFFMKESDGKRPNVYGRTYDYIMRTHKNDYFAVAQKIMNENQYLPKYITNPQTNNEAFTGKTFETITCDTSSSAKVGVTCGKGTYTIAFELFFNTMLGNKYMFDHLDQLYQGEEKVVSSTGGSLIEDEGVWVVVEYNTEEFKEVFGDKKVISCNSSDPNYNEKIKPYCKPTVTYYDEQGQVIEKDVALEECRKDVGCVKKTKYEAICSTVTGGQKITKIEVRETKPQSGTSVRKLIPCGTDELSQIMFEYVPWEKEGSHEERKEEVTTYYTNYLCGTGCNKYETRLSNDGKCTDENTFTSSISDPSLSCIVNMENPEQKNYYDFSEKFGVNTNFCRIYCSDKADYYIAGIADSESNRFFEYDVRSSATSNTLKKYELTSVVKQKRTCVSEVFYNNLPVNTNWRKLYGLSKEENERLMANPTWTTLFDIMATKSSAERDRKENLNQLVYDLYNCNLYSLSKDNMKDYGIYKPGNYKHDYARTLIQKEFGADNNYGLDNNDYYSDVIRYNGGANIATYNDSNEGAITGQVGKDADAVRTAIVRNGKNEGFGLSGVKYCKNKENKTCLQYSETNEDYSYSEFGSTETAKSHGYTFPANNYALFTVKVETGFYNDDKYQVFENTGNVIINTNYDDLISLKENVFPLDKFAYNTCNKGNCDVNQNINIAHFERVTSNDSFQAATKDKKFVCSIKVYPPFCPDETCCENGKCDNTLTLREYFVDPSNLFPSGDPEEGSNWATEEGIKARKQIESTADSLTTSDQLLEYRITLTPEQIKNIKEYNKEKGPYEKEGIDCRKENITKEGVIRYENCSSEFLSTLKLDSSFGTLDPEYSGISKYANDNPGYK